MPTPDERTAAFNAERARQLLRLVRIQRDAITEILKQLDIAQKAIATQLISVTDTLTRQRLQALQQDIARVMQTFRAAAEGSASAGLQQAWQAGTEMLTAPLAAGGLAFTTRIDPRALAALQSSLTHLIADVSASTINRINAQLAQVTIGTQTASNAISDVQRLLNSARQRAKTIVYTELGRAYSAANQASMEEAAKLLPGLRKRWVKSGKLHPRPEHVFAHGQLQPVDMPFDIDGEKLMYPRDPAGSAGNTINCGCLSIPVTDGSTWGASTVHLDPLDASVPATFAPRVVQHADGLLAGQLDDLAQPL
jgi:uncharacterized protein with gpF-like domain